MKLIDCMASTTRTKNHSAPGFIIKDGKIQFSFCVMKAMNYFSAVICLGKKHEIIGTDPQPVEQQVDQPGRRYRKNLRRFKMGNVKKKSARGQIVAVQISDSLSFYYKALLLRIWLRVHSKRYLLHIILHEFRI